MKITILGSGTCVPSLDRSAACLKIVDNATTVIMDSGPGSLRQMLLDGTTTNDIDLLCYTHLHVDHTADFVPLLFASKYAPQARTRDLSVMACPEFRTFYHTLTQAYGNWIVPEQFTLNWIEPGEPQKFECFTITTAAVQHTPHSLAYRLENRAGTSVVYSGDTDYCESLCALARNCDVLILECSFPDGMHRKGHLTPELAGRIAAQAGCRQLVLTHFYPLCDPQACCAGAAAIFDGTVIAAGDMTKIII